MLSNSKHYIIVITRKFKNLENHRILSHGLKTSLQSILSSILPLILSFGSILGKPCLKKSILKKIRLLNRINFNF